MKDRRKILAEIPADLRAYIEFEVTGPFEKGGVDPSGYYDIKALLDKREIAKLRITYNPWTYKIGFDQLYVDSTYQKSGIGNRLFQEFGKLYSENLQGYQVSETFITAVAEYAYRKAVAMGWIPAEAYNGNLTGRDYMTTPMYQQWDELKQQLPEKYRGASKIRKRMLLSRG